MSVKPPKIHIIYEGSKISAISIIQPQELGVMKYFFIIESDKVYCTKDDWFKGAECAEFDLYDFKNGVQASYVKMFNLGKAESEPASVAFVYGKTLAKIIIDNLDLMDSMFILEAILHT